ARELGPRCEVNYSIGDRVGALFTNCKSVVEPNAPDVPEVQRLLEWLKQNSQFMTKGGGYVSATQLVSGRVLAGVIDMDETRRAAFAPDSAVLSNAYSDSALRFFSKARGQLSANAVTLADWA